MQSTHALAENNQSARGDQIKHKRSSSQCLTILFYPCWSSLLVDWAFDWQSQLGLSVNDQVKAATAGRPKQQRQDGPLLPQVVGVL